MKKMVFIGLLVISSISYAQFTAIPDANFEQALINQGLDNLPIDGVVLTTNIDTVTYLLIDNKNITDLTGIEDFTALTELYCWNNQLTSLNVTQNTNLTILNCASNLLSSLDITQNTALIRLNCFTNLITSLNTSQNTALAYLECFNNQLSSLDLTQNNSLVTLLCNDNLLTSLNISQNNNLTQLFCYNNLLTCLNAKNNNNTNMMPSDFWTLNNPNLTCIEVDNVAYSSSNWTNIDAWSSFSTACGNPCFSPVGIYEKNLSDFLIYPNPTTGQLTISLEEGKASSVTIRNNLGQLLLTDNSFLGNKLELDISNYPAGIYFLHLETDGEVMTKKVVKE